MGIIDAKLTTLLSEVNLKLDADYVELKECRKLLDSKCLWMKSKMSSANLLKIGREGRMAKIRNHGKDTIQAITGKGCNRKRIVISKDEDLQIILARRKAIEYEITKLETCRDEISKATEAIAGLGGIDRGVFIAKNYDWFTPNMIEKACDYNSDIKSWANANYRKSTYKEEEKIHTTSKGLKVRSKSEMLIAEMLYSYGISFRYEEIIVIDGREYAPDFTILRADCKLFVWEHEGLTNNDNYLNRQEVKRHEYAKQGIVPWNNLIVTYDTADGCLDMKIVENEIKTKLLI